MPAPGYPGSLPSSPPGTELDRIKSCVATYFPVYETRITPQSLVLLVHAETTSLESRFDELRRALGALGYVPILRYERGEYVVEVIRKSPPRRHGYLANLILLFATIGTTVTAGAFLWLAYVGGSALSPSDFLYGGLTFALPLLGILGLHEFAHFLVARRHHVDASLPYFLPVPPPFLLFGTFGAFISLREPIPNRKALLDIGASGPLAGFAVSIPVTLFGLYLSMHAPVLPLTYCGPTILGVNYGRLILGISGLWYVLSLFLPVSLVNINPVALAGWVGILVTAINLLPAGQLDGGHVFRALFGERSRWVSYAAVVILFGLVFFYPGWAIFGILILVLGVRHPPPLNDVTRLDVKRWIVGFAAAGILLGGFVVVPIATPPGNFAVTDVGMGPVALPPGYLTAGYAALTVVNQDPIPHGYLFGTAISTVETVVNGTIVILNGTALVNFEANSTWILHLPNGNVTTYSGPTVTLPESEYSSLGSGARGSLNITYLNPQNAIVTFTVTTTALCSTGGSSPIATQFRVP